MALAEKDPDFRSLVDAAAANWYSQRSISPGASQPRSNCQLIPHLHPSLSPVANQLTHIPVGDPKGQSPHVHANGGGVGVGGQPSSGASSIGSDITAWQTALQSLPEEFRSSPLPVHPLAQSLAMQPTLRRIEWNQYRQYGGFVPRTAHDFSSLMIYASGQVNPNPCRRCILKNGPFARCIVSPPSVLAQSNLRHACANCTYQNQYKKCTNEPVTEEELVRSRAQRAGARPPPALLNDKNNNNNNSNTPPTVRKPKVNSTVRKYHKNGRLRKKLAAAADGHGHGHGYDYVVHDQQDRPTAQSISADSFADKLRRARAWSPRSRRRVRAEAMQWQAAIATVEAERTRTTGIGTDNAATPAPPPPRSTQITDSAAVAPQRSVNANVAGLPFPAPASAATTSSSVFAAPPSSLAPPPSSAFPPPASMMDESMHEMEDEGGQFYEEDDEELDDEESEGEGEGEENDFDDEGPSWVGFGDTGPVLKPPL
ncbi:hypothetical protein DL771_006986 [Monosporascus sp. 5C6A]|nr:hypothetical protein DL771_006986 [Monosporascus sp. 5C6A]